MFASIMIIEKLVGVAVVLAALTVGILTIHHGDLSLGLLVLLGQLHTLVSGHSHSAHSHVEEAAHVIAHRRH